MSKYFREGIAVKVKNLVRKTKNILKSNIIPTTSKFPNGIYREKG